MKLYKITHRQYRLLSFIGIIIITTKFIKQFILFAQAIKSDYTTELMELVSVAIQLCIFLISATIIHEIGHYSTAWHIDSKSKPSIKLPCKMNCKDWSKFKRENQIRRISYAGPIFSITFLLLISVAIFLHYNSFPFTLILGSVLELTNLIPLYVDDGTFFDGFWIKYPRIRMHYVVVLLKKKFGRYGDFIDCSNFPKCDYTENLSNYSKEEQTLLFHASIAACSSGSYCVVQWQFSQNTL